ncbi:hypothetical protein [Novosphingobium sp. 9]|nr:hypothetical protein [Novosphingobium sp. 9]
MTPDKSIAAAQQTYHSFLKVLGWTVPIILLIVAFVVFLLTS